MKPAGHAIEGSPQAPPNLDPAAAGDAVRAEIAAAGLHTSLTTGTRLVAGALRRHFNADHVDIFLTPARFREGSAMDSLVAGPNWQPRWLADPDPDHLRDVAQAIRPVIPDLLVDQSPGRGLAALRELGLRSVMRLRIIDESGLTLGSVGVASRTAGRFTEADFSQLAELAQLVASSLRRSLLIEELREERELLAQEARILAAASAAGDERSLLEGVADGLRRALGADAAVVFIGREAGLPGTLVASPPGQIDSLFWESAAAEENIPMVDWGRGVGYLNHDLAGRAATPVEERLHEEFGLRTLLLATSDASGGRPIFVAAASARAFAWGETARAFASRLVPVVHLTLERVGITSNLQEQTRRTQAVTEILAALGPGDTLSDIAGPLASALRAMYSADHVLIGTVEGGALTLAGADSVLGSGYLPESAPYASLDASSQAADRGYHVIDDLAAVTSSSPLLNTIRALGLRSSMRVLVGDPAQPHAVVSVGSLTPGRFTDAMARELHEITRPLGVAVQFFRDRDELEERTRRLEFTNRVLARIGAAGGPQELARGLLEECVEFFGACHAAVLAFDSDSDIARPLAVQSTVVPAEKFPEEIPISVVRGGDSRIEAIADARQLSEPGYFHREFFAQGVYSTMRVPLIAQGVARGKLTLWGEGTGRFSEDDAELLLTLARPFALAMERAEALASLGESESRYRSLVAQAEEMIFLFDAGSLAVLEGNAYAARALGYTTEELRDLRFDTIADLDPEVVRAHVQQVVEAGELRTSDVHYLRRDGQRILVDVVASAITYAGRTAVLVLARDVTETRGLQQQLMQAQKMESLGTMAGAVAHDFNNLLTTILGFASLLKRSPHLDTEDRENVALIEEAARHAADLTGRLLSFARGGLVRFGPVDLREVVNDTMRLASATLGDKIQARVELPPNPVHVEGDQGQLHQAVINIVLNARDAMPEGGCLEVGVHVTRAVATITIADTGHGMSEETRTRIFEPFYTTKPPGSGTGLGMAISYGIIQGHHGTIAVDSEVGRGTTFTITLPLLPDAERRTPDSFSPGEGDLIMIVDDDEMVRRTTSATLAHLGYNVVEARDGATAIQLLKARPDRFAVVLLDLVMPGLTGSETFRGMTAIRDDLPVIVCTGYAADAHIDTDVKRRIAGLVQKPFNPDRLARALTAVGARPRRR